MMCLPLNECSLKCINVMPSFGILNKIQNKDNAELHGNLHYKLSDIVTNSQCSIDYRVAVSAATRRYACSFSYLCIILLDCFSIILLDSCVYLIFFICISLDLLVIKCCIYFDINVLLCTFMNKGF